jgi:hypothetical protein
MISPVKWFLIPIGVLASALLFASLGWFQSEWFFVAFSLIGLFILFIWRRATYRLEPSFRHVNREAIDDRSYRLITKCLFITMGGQLTFSTVVLLYMIVFLLFPVSSSWTVIKLLFVILFWSSIVKFGAINILAHNILVHALSNKDLPQNPLNRSGSAAG